MLKLKVFIPASISVYCKQYGTFNDVVNYLIDYVGYGDDMAPECLDYVVPNRQIDGSYPHTVVINNLDYESAYKQYGPYAKWLSLRKLLYWFAEENKAKTWNWKQLPILSESMSQLDRIEQKLDKLLLLLEKKI